MREHKFKPVVNFKNYSLDVLVFQGMLEGLDREICDFFETDPDAVYISQSMSSYERLLAHACSMYYQLRSQSKYSSLLWSFSSNFFFLFKRKNMLTLEFQCILG